MYLNVLSFKNGKTLAFKSKIPYSVDKLEQEWNVISDEDTAQILSFRGSEVVTIANAPVIEKKDETKNNGKKSAIKTKVTKA